MRQWARRGSRPRQPADQRYESAYLFGAICPARGTGAALAMPYADSEAMQLHLVEVSSRVRRGAHAVLLLDRAGWHTTRRLVVPKNITLVFLPSRAPELNPVENIWEFMRGNWLSSRVFKSLNRTMISSIAAAPPGTNCRSALADHVHSSAPMGARVLINETCYNISASMLDQLG